MVDVTSALRSEYPGAKESFLFSLVVKAEEDGVLEHETDRAGLAFSFLKVPSSLGEEDISKNYPAAHRAVVSVIQGLIGEDIGREVPMDLVHGELRRKGYADTAQGAVDMTASATAAHVMRVQRDEGGERYALLEDPKLARGSSDSTTISEKKPVSSGVKQAAPGHAVRSPPVARSSGHSSNLLKVESYPLAHRPLVSAILILTNGQCRVRVKMETIIRALMTDASSNYRDPGLVTSLIFEAADARVVKCGKDDLGVWWTSVEEPVQPVPQIPKVTVRNDSIIRFLVTLICNPTFSANTRLKTLMGDNDSHLRTRPPSGNH
jgi:hypothetical protein